MRGIFSTLAIVWRIASPYFYSEDRWPGRILLAAVVAIELSIVGINVLLNSWNNTFYNALQDKNWDAFVYQLGYFCVLATIYILLAVYQLYLNQWLQIRWRRWLTQTYLDHWLTGANHYRMQLLGDAADNPDQRIAEDVKQFIDAGTTGIGSADRPRFAQLRRDARLVCGHPVESVGSCSASAVRHYLDNPWLSVLGGVDLCDHRHGVDAFGRPRPDRAQFPAAALRSGFPFQPGARAREFRADRAARWRTRRNATGC